MILQLTKMLMVLAVMITAVFAGESTFMQEYREFYTAKDGLLSDQVYSVTICADGKVYAGSAAGLSVFDGQNWQKAADINQPVWFVAAAKGKIAAYSADQTEGVVKGGTVTILAKDKTLKTFTLPQSLQVNCAGGALQLDGDLVFIGTTNGLFAVNHEKVKNGTEAKPVLLGLSGSEVRQISIYNNKIAIGANNGLFLSADAGKTWDRQFPAHKNHSWAPIQVNGVAFDADGRLWFACPQGIGCLDKEWTLYTGKEGLPYNEFTSAKMAKADDIWLGTQKGAIHYDGKTWEYRQGLRWVPADKINEIAVSATGDAWIATDKGLGVIKEKPLSFAEKAQYYEEEIDKYHRRTPYEYVLEVYFPTQGVKENPQKHDSDNDGLWTSMYGAGECFAYGATKDIKAKERAKKVFEAMRFLGQVTQGGEFSPPKGFVARTILPTSGHNPNDGRIAGDIAQQKNEDKFWKVIDPRWPVSKDGKWYWKTDTSSDELDGHYFFYGLYYDLVADSEAEKERVREHVKALTDHLIDHNFNLVDHDGKPTRWARYSPEELNYSENWFIERGLNSLSMLSYLATTAHITGDDYYTDVKNELIEEHSYMQNLMKQKYHHGIGTGNQSDDEMAFMAYYNLIKYEDDAEKKSRYAVSMWDSWRLLRPEMNPFFNFAMAAVGTGNVFTDVFGSNPTDPTGDWQEDAIETLQRFPLDRFDWRHENDQRIDIMPIPEANEGFDQRPVKGLGYRMNGKVIPVDENYFNHWNRNGWRLSSGGRGHGMGDGTVYLLPYYMGLYYGYIK